jgi:ABC-2 type transport system permease protein
MLQQFGVKLNEGILVQPSKEEMPQMVRPLLTSAFLDLAEEPGLLKLKQMGEPAKALMPGVAAVSYDEHTPFKVQSLLATDEKETWLKTGKLVTDSAAPIFNAQEGDARGAYTTMLSLTRSVNNKEQRIVVSGDADFLSNLRSGGGGLSRALYSWLDYNQFPIYAPRADPKDNLLTVSVASAGVIKIVTTWILPAIVLLMGIVLLIRRKRK